MSKHPQNRLRRLAIVEPIHSKPRQTPAGPRWWGPQRPSGANLDQEARAARAQFKSIRMAVMPTLSRGMWCEALAWIWSFVRSYFVPATQRKRSAVVLSFRRAAARDVFVTKKASGSVCWNNDHEATPQEGGRG
jgi:hypothetical protein